jgi:hypothetical protein
MGGGSVDAARDFNNEVKRKSKHFKRQVIPPVSSFKLEAMSGGKVCP